jgi:hypothetical protein
MRKPEIIEAAERRLIRILPADLQPWLDASATTPVNNKPT